MASKAADRPRRLAAEQRREQLVRAAMAVLARGGAEALSFEAVAQRADVTRNLLYHYFPGGIADAFRAATELAGEDLTAGWTTDPALSLDERRARNFTAMLDHAGPPTDAWAVSRITSVSTDPVVRGLADRYRGRIVDAMALNALGPTAPTPVQRTALEGYLAFAATILDAGRERELPRADVLGLLVTTLEQTVAAVR